MHASSSSKHNVLVGADARRLQSLGAQLLILVRNQVDAQGKVIDAGTFPAKVEDSDFRVRHTSIESRLGIRLRRWLRQYALEGTFMERRRPRTPRRTLRRCQRTTMPYLILAIAITSCWTASHFSDIRLMEGCQEFGQDDDDFWGLLSCEG